MKTLTFDALYEKAEEKRKKQEEEKLLGSSKLHKFFMKNLKKRMMKAKIRNIENKISEYEELFIESLTEPTMDSVDIKMKIIKFNDELKITRSLYNNLYRSRFIKFVCGIFK